MIHGPPSRSLTSGIFVASPDCAWEMSARLCILASGMSEVWHKSLCPLLLGACCHANTRRLDGFLCRPALECSLDPPSGAVLRLQRNCTTYPAG